MLKMITLTGREYGVRDVTRASHLYKLDAATLPYWQFSGFTRQADSTGYCYDPISRFLHNTVRIFRDTTIFHLFLKSRQKSSDDHYLISKNEIIDLGISTKKDDFIQMIAFLFKRQRQISKRSIEIWRIFSVLVW